MVVSRYQRVRESVLLRTLGASRRQILRITLVEYALTHGRIRGGAVLALLPLLSIRRVSPLRTLRASLEEDTAAPDPLRGVRSSDT